MKRTIPPGGTRGTVFKQVAQLRLEDASVLLERRRYPGAIYLAGYALECLLKWAITQRQQFVYLPAEFETHDLDTLLLEAGLGESLRHEGALRSMFAALADSWGPELRYLARAPKPKEAERLYREISKVYGWILEQSL
jgi:HEPN domain-containing protein